MEIVRQLNRYFETQEIAVRYSILKEPTLKYLLEIDERLDRWLQEVNAIRKGRGIHPVAKLKRELGTIAKSLFSYALAKDILWEGTVSPRQIRMRRWCIWNTTTTITRMCLSRDTMSRSAWITAISRVHISARIPKTVWRVSEKGRDGCGIWELWELRIYVAPSDPGDPEISGVSLWEREDHCGHENRVSKDDDPLSESALWGLPIVKSVHDFKERTQCENQSAAGEIPETSRFGFRNRRRTEVNGSAEQSGRRSV